MELFEQLVATHTYNHGLFNVGPLLVNKDGQQGSCDCSRDLAQEGLHSELRSVPFPPKHHVFLWRLLN